jgi:hypothetical protein
MEESFITYQPDITSKEIQKKIIKLIDKVKKYQGEFVFLWHNSCFLNKSHKSIYKKIILGDIK